MSEELELLITTEGYANFMQIMDKMDGKVGDAADAWEDLGSSSADVGRKVSQASGTFTEAGAKANRLRLVTLKLAEAQDKLEKETTEMGRAQAQVRVDDLTRQFKELSQTPVPEQMKKTKLSLTDLKSGIDLVVGGIKTFAEIAQKAFELGEEGAQIRQAGEAVQTLGLNMTELRSAAGGTIDDMSLIASTSKLLAGTTGELNAAMRDSAPRLLEIARAAVKLDPTIGSVAFVYESLAAGIKKNQPLLIDNANITVKVSTAQEKLAASLGKTVGELTDTEKSTALLYATLEGGDTLIAQVGGSVDSAADSYAKFKAQLKNITDGMKAQVSGAINPMVSAWANHYEAVNAQGGSLFTLGNALENVRLFLTGTSNATEEYAAAQEAAAEKTRFAAEMAAGYATRAEMANTKTLDLGDNVTNSADVFDQYSQAIAESEAALHEQYAAQNAANEAAIAGAIAFNDAAAAISEMSVASFVASQIAVLKQQMDDGTISAAEFEAAQEALLVKSGMLTEAERSAQSAIQSLREQFTSGKISASEFASGVLALKESVDSLESKEITITTRYVSVGRESVVGGGSAQAFASGGTLSGGAVVLDEAGPELVTGLPAGARVLSSPISRRLMERGGDTINNFNLTTQSITRPGALRLEFESMGMGAA